MPLGGPPVTDSSSAPSSAALILPSNADRATFTSCRHPVRRKHTMLLKRHRSVIPGVCMHLKQPSLVRAVKGFAGFLETYAQSPCKRLHDNMRGCDTKPNWALLLPQAKYECLRAEARHHAVHPRGWTAASPPEAAVVSPAAPAPKPPSRMRRLPRSPVLPPLPVPPQWAHPETEPPADHEGSIFKAGLSSLPPGRQLA